MPESSSASAASSSASPYLIPGAIVIAGAIIGGGLFFGLASKNGTPTPGGAAPASVNIKDVKTAGEPYIGNANAKVTMAYWSDYQCPFCKAVEVGGVPQIPTEPALPTLIKNYVDAGKLKIIFKDYPFLGNDSITAALYEHAMWKLYPDKFYTWRAAMFKAQDEEGDQGFGDETSILALIKKIPGLDANAIKADVAANTADYQKQIDADRAEGSSFGIQGTPGFIVGTQLIDGARPLADFVSAIDAQLK